VTAADMRRFVERFADLIEQNADTLTELDAAIGDADHGINMRRGMRAVRERLGTGDEATPGAVLKAVATTLISKVGGASGPLYGTAFLRAAAAAGTKESLDDRDLLALFAAALEGVRARGGAAAEDKTMVDAFAPAVGALESALDEGQSRKRALEVARDAAYAGSDATIALVARKGRASYLGERARGHRDPGSFSTALLFDAAAATLSDNGA
jgi:dihydroxyacetone kinase-like protein